MADPARRVVKRRGIAPLGNAQAQRAPRLRVPSQRDGDVFVALCREIATLFSINRPLMSSKLLRLPTRGAIGNGLRVVAGAVLASGGRLTVQTRDHCIEVTPRDDGTTDTVITSADIPSGTGIEIWFGPALPADSNALEWADLAARIGQSGESYRGKTSPHWFDADSFFELIQAAGGRIVRDLVAELDGCAGAKAGAITADFKGRSCSSLDRAEASALLRAARQNAREVNPNRLGAIGPTDQLEPHYAKITGAFISGAKLPARIPFVVEVWADAEDIEATVVDVMVNRTPITGEVVS